MTIDRVCPKTCGCTRLLGQTEGELSVEVAQKNRSLAALLSLGHQRDSATRDAAGAGNAVGGGSGAKGLLAEPGSFLWVKQEGILSAFAGSGGCLRRTSRLDGKARGDPFIATGTEAIELG